MVALLAACLGAKSTAAAQAAYRFDFEGTEVGTIPSEFSTGLTGKGLSPTWQVVEDPTAPAGPRVAAETSRDRTDYRFPVLVLDGLKARNVLVTVAFKPVSGRIDQAAGVVVRLRDPDNYYIARANALEGNVRLYKVIGGKRSQLAGKDVEIPSGRWQTLGLSIRGAHLEVLLNGERLFDARDSTLQDAGKIALWTKADSVTHFDDLRVQKLP
jgi:hypothetical protein